MGQVFRACAYDVENRVCCVIDADKFHANCYSYSGAVSSMHYLLRQKPYNIMWGGNYVLIDNYLDEVQKDEILLGISTYVDYEELECCIDDLPDQPYYDKAKYIGEQNKQWNWVSVWDKALAYFDWRNTKTVRYDGFLLNHSTKMGVDLKEYYKRSVWVNETGDSLAIDIVPFLTNTGGSVMAYTDGVSAESTEKLAGSWCGDLLQITDSIPEGYEILNCCISEVWGKGKSLYRTYGVNEEGFILCGDGDKLYEAVSINLFGRRSEPGYIKVEVEGDKVRFVGTNKL